MPVILANNKSAVLGLNISNTTTLIPLSAGQGAQFPIPAPGDFFPLVLEDNLGNYEITYCTARSGDSLTVTRAQEDTTAFGFKADTRAELRITAGVMALFLQTVGGSLLGPINANGQQIINPIVSGGLTRGTAFRASDDSLGNELVIPPGNSKPVIGGDPIATFGDLENFRVPPGVIVAFAGSIPAIPAGWVLCDGNNGTPNLLGRFILCSEPQFNPVGTFGGNVNFNTSFAGGHGHSGFVGGHALTVGEMPSHSHLLQGRQTASNNTGNAPAGTTGTAIADVAVAATGGGAAHTHGLQIDGVGDHMHFVNGVVPPYYALIYIMKV